MFRHVDSRRRLEMKEGSVTAHIIDISNVIFVNDRQYAPHDWEKAFVEYYNIVEAAKHCTQRLRIGMVNIDYHPDKRIFVAHGSSARPVFSVIEGLNPSEQLGSSSPHKTSISYGFMYFASERTKRTWRIKFTGYTLTFTRNEGNKLQLSVTGALPKISPKKDEDCS